MKPSSLIERSKILIARTAIAACLTLSALAFASATSSTAMAQADSGAAAQPAQSQPSSTPAEAAPEGQTSGGETASPESLVNAEWRQVLSQSGTFINHARYGEVWKPGVTPQSWHPYPACYWKNTRKYGWYFDDPTEWGKIVHHYGRWTNDTEHGWIWVPGKEFSAGWVVWRTSEEHIGWAPQMPDQDIKEITAEQFNKSGQWIFMDAKKFGKKCTELLPAAQQTVYLQKTRYVRDFRFVDGIAVYVLPPIFTGPFVDISVNFGPWSHNFIIQFILNINWIWNNITIVIVLPCPPDVRPVAAPIPPVVRPPPRPPIVRPPPRPPVVTPKPFCERNPTHWSCRRPPPPVTERPYCEKYPRDPKCRPVVQIPYCERYPNSRRCDTRTYCEKNPRDPKCRPVVQKPFCERFPDNRKCRPVVDRPFCVKYPRHPRCRGHIRPRPDVKPRPHVRPRPQLRPRPHVRPHPQLRPRPTFRPRPHSRPRPSYRPRPHSRPRPNYRGRPSFRSQPRARPQRQFRPNRGQFRPQGRSQRRFQNRGSRPF